MKPYDHVHGYQTILGNTQVSGLTLANFEGPAACGGTPDGPVYAMSNHQNAPDAAHPVFIKKVCDRPGILTEAAVCTWCHHTYFGRPIGSICSLARKFCTMNQTTQIQPRLQAL
jgi:hypothetical protein